MIWAWVAAVVGGIQMMILVSRLKIRFLFNRQGSNDEFTFDVHALFGLIHLRYTVPIMKLVSMCEGLLLKSEQVNAGEGHLMGDQKKSITLEKIKRGFQDFRLLLEHCFKFNEWLRNGLSHVHVTRLVWKTSIGIGDAPETALTVGTVWGLKSSLLGYLFRMLRLDTQPKLQVMPVFNHTQFEMEAVCHAYIRIVYILSAAIQLLVRILRVRDGWKTWRSVLMKSAKRPA